ncbi:MAG: VWA domain-containing protein [Pyrinomonadaceae bacterium]
MIRRLRSDDILVLEDDVPQQVRSVRSLPSHVLLLLDTGGDSPGLHGLSKSTSLSRAVAQQVVERIPASNQIAVMQTNDRVEMIQDWTADKRSVSNILEWKLIASKRSRLMEGISAAAQALATRPEGSRHIVLITDGFEAPGAKVSRAEALQKLMAARATVHIVSYTEYVRQRPEKAKKKPSPVASAWIRSANVRSRWPALIRRCRPANLAAPTEAHAAAALLSIPLCAACVRSMKRK